MGAAAFVMASFIGVTYFEVVKHAFLHAIISYIETPYLVKIYFADFIILNKLFGLCI